MTEPKLQEHISEITEIPVSVINPAVWHFLGAVGWGSLAGTLAFSVPLLIAGLLHDGGAEILLGIFIIGMIVMLFALAGMLLIGLPVTFLLQLLNAEHRYTYAALGATTGFVAMAVLFETHRMHMPEMLLFPGAGAVAGFATAFRWGRWRDALQIYRQRRAQEEEPSRRSNPIHDLIH